MIRAVFVCHITRINERYISKYGKNVWRGVREGCISVKMFATEETFGRIGHMCRDNIATDLT